MNDISEIIKGIEEASIKIKKIIENGDDSKSTNINSTGDTQLKLDIQSDEIIEEIFYKIPSIRKIVSEEQDEIKNLNENGEFLVAYDPLDGSSLVDVNLSVGSIYGIYKNDFSGKDIIASVYVVFGPRVEMVIAQNNAVKMYRLQNDKFVYIKDLVLNEKGKLNSPGGTQQNWTKEHKELIDGIFKDGYRLRYSGGMVPDLHQILIKGGGLFSYPSTSDTPNGKLRQLFEVFPFAYTYETAQGMAINGTSRVLDIDTKHIHDTSPCFFGSKNEIKRVQEAYKI
jgi:fructose-1,6-bisphosphatase I